MGVLLIQLCYYNVECGVLDPAQITNGTLEFQGNQLVISVSLNRSEFIIDFLIPAVSLSNSASFNSTCTFLIPTNEIQFSGNLSPQHTLIISQKNSSTILRYIGSNQDVVCLQDANSTFLNVLVHQMFVQVVALDVIPDTSPPQFVSAESLVDLRLGFITIAFSEVILPTTLNISLFYLTELEPRRATGGLQFSALVNSQNVFGVSSNYTLRLEVFELPHIGDVCRTGCEIQIMPGVVVSDVFGNQLITIGLSFLFPTLISYTPFSFEPHFIATPYSPTQVRIEINPPPQRIEDVIRYEMYCFTVGVNYYRGSCDYPPAYTYQENRNITQWTAENPLFTGFPPCLNTSDYMCHVSYGENVTMDIFPGNDFACILIALYPQIQFNYTGGFFNADEFYREAINLEIIVEGNGNQSSGTGGDRVLITWNVEPSFCDQHQLSFKYRSDDGETESPFGSSSAYTSYVSLDRNTTCVDQYVYIYANSETVLIVPEIRINSSQIHVPEGNCIYVGMAGMFHFIPSLELERPAIVEVREFRELGIEVYFIPFTPLPGYVVDYYNIYSFPIYALRYNGGSCSGVTSQTMPSEFTFQPTEYYIHSTRLPDRDNFPLKCHQTDELTTPYTCISVQDVLPSNVIPFDNKYAQGIVVEAVIRDNFTNEVMKLASYPYTFKIMELFEGRESNAFLEVIWFPGICQRASSFIFFHYVTFDELDNDVFELNSIVTPCTALELINRETLDPIYEYFTNYMSDVYTEDGDVCLLSYESISRQGFFNSLQSPEIIHFEYQDYETVLMTIFNGQNFSLAANIYIFPIETLQTFATNNDFCPLVTVDTRPNTNMFRFNSSIANMANLTCQNTSDYLCTRVDNTENVLISIFPGFNSIIRVEFEGNQTDPIEATQGEDFIVFSLFDSDFSLNPIYSTAVQSGSSVRFDWNVEFYCPPGSYIYFDIIGFPQLPQPPQFDEQIERRGLQELIQIDTPTLSCDTGTYTLTDLDFDTQYQTTGNVFFNSTVGFFPACPTIQFSFPNIFPVPLFQEITVINFTTIEVTWNSIPQVNTYILLGYPTDIEVILEPIGNTFLESNYTKISIGNVEQYPLQFFELCLNGTNITCSMSTTTRPNSTLSVIPGYDYELAIAFEVMGEMRIIKLPRSLELADALSEIVYVSEFSSEVFYYYRSSLCTAGVRTVFHFQDINTTFPVDACTVNQLTIPSGMLQPRVTFIFPFIDIIAPGRNVTITIESIVIVIEPRINFLPIGASPMVTTVIPPEINSDIYQVYWWFPENLPFALERETYVLYAFPYSPDLIAMYSNLCSSNATEEVEIPVFGNLDCPPPPGQVYFCAEYPTTSGDIQLLSVFDYEFLVEARYSGGLRVYHEEYIISIPAAEDISSSLNLSYQSTPYSITLIWDSMVSFCSSATFNFLLGNQEPVLCSAGSYTIGSLTHNTTYRLAYEISFDVSVIQPVTEGCIEIIQSYQPLLMTTSFCSPNNPCGAVGICSEGFQNNSFHCDCDVGYTFDGNTCVDVDECSTILNVCSNAACLNNLGSFTCTCLEGYIDLLDVICVDIDECEIANNCVNGNCTNLLAPQFYRCDCEAGFEGSSCAISVEIPTCPSISESTLLSNNNVTFPVTEYGVVAVVSCSQLDTQLFGNITRQCLDTGEWGPINLDDCQRIAFVVLEQITSMSEVRILTPVESAALSEDLNTATQVTGSLFPGEVSVAATGVGAIADSLFNLTGQELIESLNLVQSNVVRITSNVLSATNEPAFEAATPSEAQNYVDDLVDGIQDLGILIASVAEENATIVLEISEPTVAIIVTVERDRVEDLVLGSNLTMAVGNNASAVMAAQASVTIPAALFPPEEAIAVSVALFSSVQDLLGNVFLNESATSENNQVDILTSSIVSVNLFTRAGERINVLEEPITLRFVVNGSDIPDDPESRVQIRCASARQLSDGWDFIYVLLTNPNEVPNEPANCAASHLTHFGVLVSVTSNDFSEGEILALEILTYVTSGFSISALTFSVVAYGIVWWKTRKNKRSPFKKDATILHVNFAISLLLALTIFLASVAAYGHEAVCKAFTIFQYYLWLSVFSSSLSIGIYLLIKIFAWSSQRRIWYYLVPFSWALPLPLIIITPSVARNELINTRDEVCWFAKEPSFANLGFIIPMLVITITNLVVLCITAVVLIRISKGDKSMVSKVRGVLIASFILTPILGLPWLFSIITSAPTSVISFIFVIILGLQGVLFTILYPLRTQEVIDYVLRCKSSSQNAMQLVSTSAATGSRNPPSALKFKVKRPGESISKTTSVSKSKAEGIVVDDFNSQDVHMEVPQSPKLVSAEEANVLTPEAYYGASLHTDVEVMSKPSSPPPYASLGDESETRL